MSDVLEKHKNTQINKVIKSWSPTRKNIIVFGGPLITFLIAAFGNAFIQSLFMPKDTNPEKVSHVVTTPTPSPALEVLGCNDQKEYCGEFSDDIWKDEKEKFIIQDPEKPQVLSAPIKGKKRGAMMYYNNKIGPNFVLTTKVKPYGKTSLGLVMVEWGKAIRCILGDGDRRSFRCYTSATQGQDWTVQPAKYLPYGDGIQPETEVSATIKMSVVTSNQIAVTADIIYISEQDGAAKEKHIEQHITLPILVAKTELRDIGVGLVDHKRLGDIEAEFLQFSLQTLD